MAFVNYVFWQRNRQRNLTVDTITCKAWRVVGADGKIRIAAAILADGQASVVWLDKDEKVRIKAATLAGGQACVTWLDKDGKVRINAATLADGQAGVGWFDKDGKVRINAATVADGTVFLPTKDLKPPNVEVRWGNQ